MKKKIKILMFIVLVIVFVFAIILLLQKPSHNRNWELGQEELPKVEIRGDEIEIKNFRDFAWSGEMTAEKKYTNKKFRINEIQKTQFIISHFSNFEGLAHVFLGFVFPNGEKIIMSMEARRNDGEEFSPTLGLMRKFETVYILGSEEDIIGVRTDFRDERVYVYPTVFTAKESQDLFLKIAQAVNEIYDKPKFYNTLWNNCMNALSRPIEEISNFNFPFTYKILMPGYIDEVLYEMKMIPDINNKIFEEVKSQYLLKNEK